jgi:hypothetical protein
VSLRTQDRAHLANDAYEDRSREAATEHEKLDIDGRDYEVIAYVSARSGYQGTAYRDRVSGEVVIANRGTEFAREIIRDVVLADGGMVVKAVNAQADDAIAFAKETIELVEARARKRGDSLPLITAVGHSLGGTEAQIQAHHLGIKAETFNAYGAADLAIVQGPAKPGTQVVNHVDAADFVSAASRHIGEVRVYATEQDIAHLRKQDYGLPPYRPEVPALASPTTSIARWFTQPDPVATALSGHGIGAHSIATMAPAHVGGPSVLTEANRHRYEENRALVDTYRNDIRELRHGLSAHAQEWPRAVEATGWAARRVSTAMEGAALAHSMLQATREAPIRVGQTLIAGAQWLDRNTGETAPHPSSSPVGAPPGRDAPRLDARAIEESTRQFLHDTPQSHQPKREPLGYSDPAHPHHPLFRELRNKLPGDVSDDKVAELTLAAREGGVRPNRVDSVHVLENGDALVLGKIPGFVGMVNLHSPAPSMAETTQKAETFELQEQAQLAQRQEQRQSQSHGRSV